MQQNRVREVHSRKSLTYRKGKKRLRVLTIPQLLEITGKEKNGRRFEAARKEIVRKQKLGVVYNAPQSAEEADNGEVQSAE